MIIVSRGTYILSFGQTGWPPLIKRIKPVNDNEILPTDYKLEK